MKNYFLYLILFFNVFVPHLSAQKSKLIQKQDNQIQISSKAKDNSKPDPDKEKLIQNDSTSGDWNKLPDENSRAPVNSEINFVRDSENVTYTGSKYGILMWDGFSHLRITDENSNIPENNITALALDHKAQLWIGTHHSGIVIGTGSPVKPYKTKVIRTHDQNIFGISVDDQGLVWVTYQNGGLECFKDEVSKAYVPNQ